MRVMTLYLDCGMTGAQISRKTGYKQSTVYHWLKHLPTRASLKDAPRSGRPPKCDEKAREKIVTLAKGNRRRSTRRVAKMIRSEGLNIGKDTVRRVLKDEGLIAHRLSKRQLLTEIQKEKRLNFAIKYENHDWANTLITDEKHFPLYPPPNRRNDVIWDERGVGSVSEQVKYPPTIRVWAGIRSHGATSLYENEGALNTNRYVDILDQALPEIQRLSGGTPFVFNRTGHYLIPRSLQLISYVNTLCIQ